MKYWIFWTAVALLPAFSWLVSLNHRWFRWALYGMVAGVCLLERTAINFFSFETYRGSSRGMEVNLIHLMAFVLLGALALRGKWQRPFPEGGIRLYALYFLLCLPSLANADDPLLGWCELWKMLMMFVAWHAVFGYLSATDDVESVLKVLAFVVLANTFEVVKQHYGGVHMAKGMFPHRNGMSMAMNLLGPVFFAGYLQQGLGTRVGRWCAVVFPGAVLSTMWSYSRGAIAMVPVGYGMVALACLAGAPGAGGRVRLLKRSSPLLLAGLLGLVAIWPNLVARFTVGESAQKHSSKDTRIVLAHFAMEMMRDHPWAGVGVNNWSLNLLEPHTYREDAAFRMGRDNLPHMAIVETVYLLVGAECGIPALLAMLAWFGWHWAACLGMVSRLRGTKWQFLPTGLLGGLSADYAQSILEWVLRQKTVLFLLVVCFALTAYLRAWGHKHPLEATADPEGRT